MKKVETTSSVKVHYTGRLEDGTIFDTSIAEGREPLEVQLGQGQLIKGFESGLIDMLEGDKKTIELSVEDSYGEPNPEFINEVPKSNVPEGIQVGESLQGMGPQGPVNVLVVEVNEETVVLDANHPLAGKRLIFDLEVIEISE
jgi:FKBP-type peptidyl-prolyl cis-trans isomerase SlpA